MGTITFMTEDGPVPFELPATAGVGAVAGRDGTPDVSSERLEDALALVGRVAASLERSLGDLKFAKAEATVSIKVSAEGSFIVAKSAAEASISITLALSQNGA